MNEDENQLSEAESQQSEVRVQFTDPDGNDNVVEAKAEGGDQQGAASDNEAALDDLSLDDADASDENRNKRYSIAPILETSPSSSHLQGLFILWNQDI